MIRDDFGYPNFQEKSMHTKTVPVTHTSGMKRWHKTLINEMIITLFSKARRQIQCLVMRFPHQLDSRSYLAESTRGTMDGIIGDGATREMNTTPLIHPSKAHKRERHESRSNPSFSPPLPGDTGDDSIYFQAIRVRTTCMVMVNEHRND
jgi:hypothetical protein